MIQYQRYSKQLRQYCKELGITEINTHGLRHSTSELYLHYGATRDDVRQLLGHSSSKVTDGYIHGHGSRLKDVAKVIQLFPDQNVPKNRPCVG